MLKVDGIDLEYFGSVSLEVEQGSVCKVITKSDSMKNMLMDIVLGLKKPAVGSVFLLGRNIYSISEKEYIKLFRQVGIVSEDGSMISNLKIWENIVLPLWYHTRSLPADIEDRVIGITAEMGIETSYLRELAGRLPGPVPDQVKRILGLTRTMLMEPDLMIYGSIFEGMAPKTAERLIGMTERFHSGKPGRTSVYITSDPQSVAGIRSDQTVEIGR